MTKKRYFTQRGKGTKELRIKSRSVILTAKDATHTGRNLTLRTQKKSVRNTKKRIVKAGGKFLKITHPMNEFIG